MAEPFSLGLVVSPVKLTTACLLPGAALTLVGDAGPRTGVVKVAAVAFTDSPASLTAVIETAYAVCGVKSVRLVEVWVKPDMTFTPCT